MRFSTLKTILSGIFLIDANESDSYLPILNNILSKGPAISEFAFDTPPPIFMNENGVKYNAMSELPAQSKSVAVIHLSDVIMKYGDNCGLIGTQEHTDLLGACFASEDISGVVFEVDSPGGAADAVEVLSAAINARNKPVLFHVNGMMASAAYWIASNGDEIHSDLPGSKIGSIGALWTLVNTDGVYEKEGAKITRLFAKQSNNKAKGFRDFIEKGNTDLLQNELDDVAADFIEQINTSRGIAKDSEVMQGGIYKTEIALSFGLIDGTLTLAETIERCMDLSEGYQAPKRSNTEIKKETKMFGTNKNTFKALAILAATNVAERTQEQVEAANAELVEAGINAELIEAGEIAKLNSTVENLTDSLAESLKDVESNKTALEAKLNTEKAAKEASEALLGKVNAIFGEDADADGFDLEASVKKLSEEREKFANLVPGGASAIKEGADDLGDGDVELSEIEKKMRKDANEY